MIVSGNMLVQLDIQHVQLLVLWQAVVFLYIGPGKLFLAPNVNSMMKLNI